MKNENFRTENKDLNEYIEALEAKLDTYGASNTLKLFASIDKMAGKISDALDRISNDEKDIKGNEIELSGKFVDTFIKMVEKADKIKGFIDISNAVFNPKASADKKTTTVIVEEETVMHTESGKNKFEEVQERIKKKISNTN